MTSEIKTINLGGVNCYLIKIDTGYILIDTGFANKRAVLDQELDSAGCKPGNLKLVILSHGDSDHADNAAYLRNKYGAKIAMHRDDSGMVERGDMSWNRKAKPDRVAIIFRIILLLPARQSKFETFTPDIYLEDGQELSEYGFDAKVLHLPGHSRGSIGLLTTDGVLFCGDLLSNLLKPGYLFIDDLAAWKASMQKLKQFNIKTVYSGHGKPFPMDAFLDRQR